jgi:hypothetical protein
MNNNWFSNGELINVDHTFGESFNKRQDMKVPDLSLFSAMAKKSPEEAAACREGRKVLCRGGTGGDRRLWQGERP